MSNQNFPRRLLDDAIDRAVQDMTQRDPRTGFRARVQTRIRRPAVQRRWIPMFGWPAAALAVLALAVLWPRPAADPLPVAQITAKGTPASLGETPRSSSPSRPSRPGSRSVGATRSAEAIFGPRRDRVSAASIAEVRSGELSAGDAVAPPIAAEPAIVIAPLAVPANIVVRPIEIRDIVFTPPSVVR